MIVSLAGRTSDPPDQTGDVRRGGFGGLEGLKAFLAEQQIEIVVDATHPFAANISRNAAEACEAVGCTYLRLERPPWRHGFGDRWQEFASVEEAAASVPGGETVFVTVGSNALAPFLERDDIKLVARVIEDPPAIGNREVTLIKARGPFMIDDECDLFKEHGIDVLVAKNSGGEATSAKLVAARRIGLPVIMVHRPPDQPAPDAADAEHMLKALKRHLA